MGYLLKFRNFGVEIVTIKDWLFSYYILRRRRSNIYISHLILIALVILAKYESKISLWQSSTFHKFSNCIFDNYLSFKIAQKNVKSCFSNFNKYIYTVSFLEGGFCIRRKSNSEIFSSPGKFIEIQ